MRDYSRRTELRRRWVLQRLAIVSAQFYRWTERYGRVNMHNGQIPRDHWLTVEERAAILLYHEAHAPEGYRRMTFMMLDADVVAVSPATVYRVLKAEGLLDRWNGAPSKKGTVLCNPGSHTSTGTSTSAISTSPARSTTSARSSMARRAFSSTGSCASR